jgi:hypothetical protein
MAAQRLTQPRSLSRLEWWEWVEILGAAGLVAVLILLIAGRIPHPAVVALTLHVAADFTFQSPETALRKAECRRYLLVHALAAGGLPLAVAGLLTQNPLAVVTWMVAGAISHYVVDRTRKFGLRQVALAVTLDQTCHLLTILVLVLIS